MTVDASVRAAAPAESGHLLVASLLHGDRRRLVTVLKSLPPAVDVAEVRLDGIWSVTPEPDAATEDLFALREATDRRLIATLRPLREGGLFEGPEEARLGLLIAASQTGFDLVDLELPEGAAGPFLHAFREQVPDFLLSRHLPEAPHCRDDSLLPLAAMADGHGLYDKLAFPAGAFLDDLRAIEAVRLHAARNGKPSISTLGSTWSAELRAVLAVAGNHATYGHAPGLEPAVPGQPPAVAIQALWDHWGIARADLAGPGRPLRPWMAVLGNPVDKSLSPRMHNATLRSTGRAERYVSCHVPSSPAALRLVVSVAPRIGLVGASVTAPHKTDAARMATCDATATAVGAANQLKFHADGKVDATNTDATALRDLLRPHVRPGTSAIVLGAGGAARAALWALKELGTTATYTSRDPKRAAEAKHLGTWVPWEQRSTLRADVWVQATTLGLQANDPSPGTPHGVRLAFELNYKGGPTAFAAEARSLGATLLDGRALVLEQAVHAQRFWFGAEPDRRAMEAALGR